MSVPILIRALSLQSPTGQYVVRFDDETGNVLPVAVVGGPMRTGKTSLFGFIDWCLGDSKHPDHPQFAGLTVALLEADLRGERRVLARRVFDDSSAVQIHHCGLGELMKPHSVVKYPVTLPSDPESLSAYLVEICGLDGSLIRRRPSAADSETMALSYRNLSWLSYLPSRRLEDHVLLHEDRPQDKMHQHRQTLDIVFDVADENLSQATARLNAAKNRVSSLDSQIKAVQRFLGDTVIPKAEIDEAISNEEAEAGRLSERLLRLDETIRAEESFPDELRSRASDALDQVTRISVEMRARKSLLGRLTPLRNQYVEELKKLNFVHEAQQVLDPIPVTRCPVCSSGLDAPGLDLGTCQLCGQHPETSSPDKPIDVGAEIRSVQTRLRELIAYMAEVDNEQDRLRERLTEARSSEQRAQRELDDAARRAVTPFLAERDQVAAAQSEVRSRLAALRGDLAQRAALDDLFLGLHQARDDVKKRQEEAERLQEDQPSRDAVILDLSRRFNSLMHEVGFPGLHVAEVSNDYAPIINGRPYTAETSSGAQTVISVCWQLAVFELLVEAGQAHPGHLMIDSIQKGMAQQKTPGIDDRFSDPAIIDRMYAHIREWSTSREGRAQVIIVDQSIPQKYRDLLVIEFTRDPSNPPAGLIHDAAEVSGNA